MHLYSSTLCLCPCPCSCQYPCSYTYSCVDLPCLFQWKTSKLKYPYLGNVLTLSVLCFFLQNNQQITKNVFYIYNVSDIFNRILDRCIEMKTIYLPVWKSLGFIHTLQYVSKKSKAIEKIISRL